MSKYYKILLSSISILDGFHGTCVFENTMNVFGA